MATSEIEKLERRYSENPQGLTFAPLAEVHRKSGDVARALELLLAGLELHPNYIPASIVLGRCHQDRGDLPAAEAAFAHVLRLDDENVIALKCLADINERQDRFDEAESWLRRLVAVDRSNDEAREQLRRIETAKEKVRATPAPEPEPSVTSEPSTVSEPATASEPTTVSDPLPFIAGTEPATASEPTTASDPLPFVAGTEPALAGEGHAPVGLAQTDSVPADLPPIDIAVLDLTEQIAEPAMRPDTARHPGEPAETALSVDDRALPVSWEGKPPEAGSLNESEKEGSTAEPVQPVAGLVSAEFVPPPPQAPDGIGVETSEEVVLESSGISEFRVPDASEDFISIAASHNAARERSSADRPKVTHEAARQHPPEEPEFVVTETMAEILMQQGHADDALRIYRVLARRSEGDARLQSRVQELEAAVARLSARSVSYVARETNGQSVTSFFQAMLAARPPAADTDSPGSARTSLSAEGGASTRPAQDALSRSSVFGEDSLPVPPAVPGEQRTEAGVSFDAFFNPPAEGSSPATGRTPDPGNDDLDQFHSWLQNLKR